MELDKLAEGYTLIEGPVWHPDRGLIFSDVHAGGVYAVTDDGTVSTVFEHRRGIGGMALHANGAGMVVSGRNIAYKPFDGGDTVELLALDQSAGAVGFNDITTDGHGRIYAGELGASPFADDAGEVAGRLWLIDVDGSSQVVGHDVLLTNGLGFSPSGHTLYHSDSTRGVVMQYRVHDDGTLGPKEPFAEPERGAPDGLVVAEDGTVWVALAAGGHGVAVFDDLGEQVEHIEIPLPMCTSLCFGGSNLRRLYIVSGSDGVDRDTAGTVFVTETPVAGLPVAPAQVPLG